MRTQKFKKLLKNIRKRTRVKVNINPRVHIHVVQKGEKRKVRAKVLRVMADIKRVRRRKIRKRIRVRKREIGVRRSIRKRRIENVLDLGQPLPNIKIKNTKIKVKA